MRQGDLPAGEAEIRSALEMANTAQMSMALTTGAFMLLDAMAERDSTRIWVSCFETIDLEPAFARTWSGAHLFMVRAEGRLARQDSEGGLAEPRAAYAIQADLSWGPRASTIRSTLALASRACAGRCRGRATDPRMEPARALRTPAGALRRARREVGRLETRALGELAATRCQARTDRRDGTSPLSPRAERRVVDLATGGAT